MRLIDADEYKGKAICNHTYSGVKKLISVDDIPTAYDIDKVVEALKTESSVKLYGSNNSNNYLIPVNRAIEIVKQDGVVDDVCEWKIDGVYLHSPHNKPFVTCIANDEDYRYHFCPVCGKKIKAVE